MKGLLKFIAVLIILALILALALVIFDMTGYPRDPEHTTANAFLTSVRNLFPASWVEGYDVWRGHFLQWFGRTFNTANADPSADAVRVLLL